MKDTLKPGLEFRFTYPVPANRTVPHLYPESPAFIAMPDVFATGYMVGLMEWACIEALMPYLDWPAEQTVGTHVDVSHVAATPPGMTVSVTVRLEAIEGKKLVFHVSAHDGLDLIGEGRHERFVIDRSRFDAKLAGKRAKAGA